MEICSVSSKPMGLSDPHDPDQTFPFQYLQRAGAGSRSLCHPFITKLFGVPCAKVYVDSYDMWADLVGHYKSPSSTTNRPIRIVFDNQPALDTGGVRRQCYTQVYEQFAANKHMRMFDGPPCHLRPVFSAEARS